MSHCAKDWSGNRKPRTAADLGECVAASPADVWNPDDRVALGPVSLDDDWHLDDRVALGPAALAELGPESKGGAA